MGGWAIAQLRSNHDYHNNLIIHEQRPILGTTITLERLYT